MMNGNWVTGMFHDRASAEKATDAIMRAGYRAEDVSVVMTDDARRNHFTSSTDTGNRASNAGMVDKHLTEEKVAEGVGVGGLVGGSVGAVLAGIAAVGTSLLVPGLGLVVAGPIAAALAGAGAGGATGGLIGGLVNAGVPEDHARHYEGGLTKGGILVAVKARTDEHAAQLRRWFDEAGADNVRTGAKI